MKSEKRIVFQTGSFVNFASMGVEFALQTAQNFFNFKKGMVIKMNPEDIEKIKDVKEITDVFEHYMKLELQIQNPDRNGMIEALKNAKITAQSEIANLEFQQGDIYYMPWECFGDRDLYRKLSQYQIGLKKHLVSKMGEKAFNEMLKRYMNHN